MGQITYRIQDDIVFAFKNTGDGFCSIIEIAPDAPEYDQAMLDAESGNQSPSWWPSDQ
jgi:hypothetical protein